MEYQKIITLRQFWGLIYPYTRAHLAIVSYDADSDEYSTTYDREIPERATNMSGEFPEEWERYADYGVYLVQAIDHSKMFIHIRKEEEE